VHEVRYVRVNDGLFVSYADRHARA
jgi:hypothetical protein